MKLLILSCLLFATSLAQTGCGSVPSTCEGHLTWAVNQGRWVSSNYPEFQSVTGVALTNAVLEDFTLYFFCSSIHQPGDCTGIEAPCGRSCDPVSSSSTSSTQAVGCETAGNAGNLGFALSMGLMASPLPPNKVASIVRDSGVKKLRLYGWNTDVQTISSILALVPDATFVIEIIPDDVDQCANDQSHCESILEQYAPYEQAITHVAVGNEPLHAGSVATFSLIATAVANVNSALQSLGFSSTRTTVPFSMNVLQNTWPIADSIFVEPPSPSSQGCGSGCIQSAPNSLMDTLLAQLDAVNGVLSIHPYAYFVAVGDHDLLDLSLDATSIMNNQVLSFQTAMSKLNRDIPLMITEVGWATFPEPIATLAHTQQFLYSLSNSLSRTDLAYSGIDVYAFEFFDESLKSGASDEPHFGWYTEAGCKKFDIMQVQTLIWLMQRNSEQW